MFQPDLRTLVSSASLQHSPLLDYPLMRFEDRIVFALPTAVSIAVRRLLFGGLIDSGLRREGVALLEDEYKRLLRHRPFFGLGRQPPIFFREAGDCMVAEYAADIESGRFMHFIFILDTLQGFEKDGFASHAPHEPRPNFISEEITAYRNHLEQSGEVKEGVTVVVSCGIGRSSVGLAPLLSPEAAGDWDTVFLSAADAETLTLLQITPQTVLRICRAQRILARQGVHLFNFNGFPNLFAWVRSLGGHLVDHGNMPDEMRTSLHLVLPTDMILNLRKEKALKVDRHMVSLPNGHMAQVRRLSDSFFADDAAQPLYFDECWSEHYGLRLVYLGEQVNFWCEVRPSGYERWKMLWTWLPRIGEALSSQCAMSSPSSLLFQVYFDSQIAVGREAPGVPSANQIANSISVEFDTNTACIAIHVGEAFEHGLADPRNISESMLVQRMVEGALTLLCGEIDAKSLQNLHHAIVPNADARDAHLFHARQFRDFVRNSLPDSPVVVDPIDEGIDRLGLGWRHRSRDDGPQVDGKEECSVFLSNVVRGIEDDLCADLRTFDRRRVILFALGNHEAAMVRQHRWRTTARANLGLHDSRAAALQTILDKESENNASLLGSRVLVELALCECPTNGGVTPGEIDLARLMSKLLLAIHYGGWSDAIYYDAMQPSLRITPLGDIHGHVDFLTDVAEPFGRMAGEVMLDSAVDRYAHNFEIPETAPAVSDVFDQRFLAAWEAEKGVSIDDWRLFADLLEGIGRAEQKAVFSMRCSQLAERLCGDLPNWRDIADSLTIRPRSSWREVPEGFVEKDLWPWRFRRQLTLVRRPLVQLDAGPNPEFVIVPGLVRDAVSHTVCGYHDGSFSHVQLVSDEMRSWFGTVAQERGHAFCDDVASHVRQCCGWKCESEVPVRRILGGRMSDRFGDIDALCWNAATGHVLLLECKDLHFHKSIGEMAEQVQDFRGKGVGRRRDDMRKHIDRTAAIKGDVAALQRYLRLEGELNIESWVVFKHPVPILLSWTEDESGVKVTTFRRLSAILSG